MAYEINIDGFIGEAGFFGGDNFTLKMLNEKLSAMPSDTTEINVVINSGGGYVTEGFAIYDKLASLSQTVNTTVLGLCGSIATVIAQAGKKGVRSGYENSDYFIHPPAWSPQSPDPIEADELQQIANDLKANQTKLANFYAQNGTGTAEFFLDKMKEAKSLSMEEAKSLGLIDNIISTQIKAATIYKFAAHTSKPINTMNAFENKLKEMFTSFKNEITAIVKPVVTNEKVTTSEGVDIFYDGVLEMGTKVFTEVEMKTPAPDGVHTVDGKLYTITNGEVTKVEDVQTGATELEQAKARVAELEKQVAEKEAAVVAQVTEAVAAKEIELTAKFETQFTAFKAKFFTGEKLNEEIVQIMKNEGEPKPKDWRDEVIALRNKK